jgi:hypothetical protein
MSSYITLNMEAIFSTKAMGTLQQMGRNQGKGEDTGLQLSLPNRNKKTDFVDTIILNVLRDLPSTEVNRCNRGN